MSETESDIMNRFHRLYSLATCAIIVMVAGCQDNSYPMAPVEGVVLQNGRPVANVQVMFYPERESGVTGPRSLSRTDDVGHFRLQTEDGADGAVIGKHRVVVIDVEYEERTAPLPPNHPLRLKYKDKGRPVKRIKDDYREYFHTPLRSEATAPSSMVTIEVK